ncbi:MAG: O-antigen ligase family protein [Bacteroidales bacterium]|nr:O-antigen ligase family protein [Bacteroidales bacterium]
MNALLKDIEDKRPILLFGIYYLALLMIALSWTNRNLVEPNIVFRLAFITCFVLPLLKYPYIAPALITIFATIRLFSVAPFGYLPSQSSFYLLLVAALYIYYLYFGLSSSRINSGIFLLLVVVVFSNIINSAFKLEFIQLLLISVLLVKLMSHWKEIRLMEVGFIIVSFCLSIYGLIFFKDFIIHSAANQGVDRMYWSDPNYLGCVIAIGIVISFYYFFESHDEKLIFRLFYLLTFILGMVTLGMLASRSAFLVAILPIVYIVFRKANSLTNILIIALLIIGIGIAFSKVSYFEPLIDRFREESIYTGSDRTYIWRESFKTFIASNFKTLLIGGGSHYSSELVGQAVGNVHGSPHNNFLEIFYDYGIIGLMTYIGLFVNWFLRNRSNTLGIALIFILLLTSITLSPLMYLPFWLLIVLIEKQ